MGRNQVNVVAKNPLISPPLPTVTNNESSLNISSVVDYLMIDHG